MSELDQVEQESARQESTVTAPFPPSSNLPEVQSPPLPVISFVTLLGQSRRESSLPKSQNQSLAYANLDKVDEELNCPICHDIMKEVIATTCGHSFCYECICEQIKYQPECPLCRSQLSRTEMYPNFQLNRLAELRTQVVEKSAPIYKSDPMEALLRRIKNDRLSIATSMANSLTYADIESIFQSTLDTKRKMEREELKIKSDLLDAFLIRLKNRNDTTIQNLILQNKLILSDLDMLDIARRDQQQPEDQSTEEAEMGDGNTRVASRVRSEEADGLNDRSLSNRMDERFHDLKELYYSKMAPDPENAILDEDERCSRLESFSSVLYDVTRYGTLDVLDTLHYADTTHSTSIVSSIEFDKDDELFAVGGILKDIKIYDFRLTCRGPNEARTATIHCPVRRIKCDNKISCLSWSSYIKSQVASADYQGVINVWDVTTGQKTSSFVEHKKRAWSVDTSARNPNLIASGSDDTSVKVWSLTSQRSLFTFQHKGNICCAKFAPNNSNYLAVGSADHQIICYDLRNPSVPLHTYQGHQKAVSYVKWMNDDELISASTDNSLKLWNRETTECTRTYTGHLNEKNFVGLSVNNDWIACGSETNTVYTYHKYSKTPIAKYKFPIDPIPGKMITENDPTYFVSSVCWKRDTSKLISANSKGVVRVLQLK
ncbi:hypothetical protein G6F57_005309 [Rhizopus arrhizus]|uniref:RING-type domain-containing protein n=1 Tax=Rhizopus oryzae TaxID=64495 RepID=A0A9P6XC83_RHIOR|nr:hypothetical protein G6F23_007499 [Rhizopus arrhizus]KAG1412807.1 hypothetical protein G6F58_007827 [Rhizopus delemar]KAG0764245.1 hypothetical protein G6F24_005373 [Rhizopus arrhizus]KAG0790388.1 hypothetical protein G6F21_005847 [Rhizopus arrhizus]KAG0811893.1 hypothetical protein G6F20_006800 [Rhizopus arrhizus]